MIFFFSSIIHSFNTSKKAATYFLRYDGFINYPLVKRVGYMFHYVCLCVCVCGQP